MTSAVISSFFVQIGVPFYIPVEEGVTHREVQHMVWHRVKFIAWVRRLTNIMDTGGFRLFSKCIAWVRRPPNVPDTGGDRYSP